MKFFLYKRITLINKKQSIKNYNLNTYIQMSIIYLLIVMHVYTINFLAFVDLSDMIVRRVSVLGSMLAIGTLKSWCFKAGVLEVLLKTTQVGETAGTSGAPEFTPRGRQQKLRASETSWD